MSTIQDVARHAGVSVSTVSNVLNGRTDQMRQETLARVQAAMTALQYRPSTLARQLKTGQTPLVGLLVPSIANPMYGYIAREVETYAQERYGYRVLIGNTYRDPAKEASFFEDLLSHGVRRVIVISSLADERHLETAAERGMVVVSYDRRATEGETTRIDHVTPDNFEAARLATRHLIAHGHTRLGYATLAGMTLSRRDKIRGFLAAAEEAGLGHGARVLDSGPVNEYGDSMIAENGRALARQLSEDAARPTGIVAVNDLMALGLMAGLRESGLRVPDDMSVVGMDGHFLAAISNPALTTVQLPVPAMAAAMVERVMRQQDDAVIDSAQALFTDITLVERESVAPPAAKAT
ncbi:LacI family DNA-binding transcriptional regulator [Caballeronia sp. LP006]|jgi:DNA-binding LacI/PurR family transcriptional regulator|uniref:LacI family DNA-binding transcriptional regulator n=1 Tax=unclassified Caballeronia TaxID=2646786 RepID=UPI001FD06B60|nr:MULTISPECIES: LacI family DNA-binding transcriptional regulator [unclassified Caballeronia]MDR5773754.1 LacI family DNA-binding transcriptional regulator [Caballeronia sp. LZ002]MDR5827317.1 LacI family DNA-binding transcriptional regulator [Caballeronia sp. LP006]MDR5849189.1 LacI family DNA-binding transcriptional regulator [Caballeronia sp. LZ003]